MRQRILFTLLAALGAATMFTPQSPALGKGNDGLIVHEWGTFTTLQDEDGRELSGINIDDEPVPRFVHDVNPALLASPVLTSTHWEYRMKGAPRAHPLVTMRLETPVIYFYPPKGVTEAFPIDVHVKFRGGWLTQFYPHAVFSAPQLETGSSVFGPSALVPTCRSFQVRLPTVSGVSLPKSNEPVSSCGALKTAWG